MKGHWRYTAILLLAMFFWGSAFVGIRVAVLNGFGPGSLTMVRYAIAGVTLLPFMFKRVTPKTRLRPVEWLLVIVTGIIGIGLYGICLNHGEMVVSAGISAFIISQESVMMIVVGWLLLNEKTSHLAVPGIIVSIIGIAMIAWSKNHETASLMGVAWILIAAVLAACYNLLQRPLSRKVGALQFTFYAIVSSTIFLSFFYIPELKQVIPHLNYKAIISVIYLAIFPGILGYLLLSIAAPKVPIGEVAAMLFLIPVFSTLLGWVVIDEIPSTLALCGGLVTLAGAIWTHVFAKH